MTFSKSRGIIYLALSVSLQRQPNMDARVVELVDSLASGASARKGVRVRLPPRAPKKKNICLAGVLLFSYYNKAGTGLNPAIFRSDVPQRVKAIPAGNQLPETDFRICRIAVVPVLEVAVSYLGP